MHFQKRYKAAKSADALARLIADERAALEGLEKTLGTAQSELETHALAADREAVAAMQRAIRIAEDALEFQEIRIRRLDEEHAQRVAGERDAEVEAIRVRAAALSDEAVERLVTTLEPHFLAAAEALKIFDAACAEVYRMEMTLQGLLAARGDLRPGHGLRAGDRGFIPPKALLQTRYPQRQKTNAPTPLPDCTVLPSPRGGPELWPPVRR